jgi:hypothetical protein
MQRLPSALQYADVVVSAALVGLTAQAVAKVMARAAKNVLAKRIGTSTGGMNGCRL